MKRAAGLAVTLLLLAALLVLLMRAPPSVAAGWQAALAAAFARLAGLPLWGAAAFIAGLLASYGLRGWRVQAEWGRRAGVGYAECLRVMAMHNALVNLMPMRSGEAGFSWLLWRRWGVGLADSALSLLRWRLQDLLVLGVLGVWLLLPAPAAARVALVLALLAVAGVAARLRQPLALRLHGLARRMAGDESWSAPVARLVARLAEALGHGTGGAAALALSAANWLVKLAALGGMLAFLAGLDGWAAFAAALGGELGAALPVQPVAGFGTYEAGAWAAVVAQAGASLPAAQVLSAALAAHLLSLTVALAAGALAWVWSRACRRAALPSGTRSAAVASAGVRVAAGRGEGLPAGAAGHPGDNPPPCPQK